MKRAILFSVLTSVVFASGGSVPRKAPFFQIQLDSTRGYALEQFQGHALILAFVLTDCSHCQFTTNLLNAIQREYSQRVQVMGSVVSESATAIDAFRNEAHPIFPVGYNKLASVVNFTGHGPGAVPMPIVMFIDAHGIIRKQFDSNNKDMDDTEQDKNLRYALEETLSAGETAPPKAAPNGKKGS